MVDAYVKEVRQPACAADTHRRTCPDTARAPARMQSAQSVHAAPHRVRARFCAACTRASTCVAFTTGPWLTVRAAGAGRAAGCACTHMQSELICSPADTTCASRRCAAPPASTQPAPACPRRLPLPPPPFEQDFEWNAGYSIKVRRQLWRNTRAYARHAMRMHKRTHTHTEVQHYAHASDRACPCFWVAPGRRTQFGLYEWSPWPWGKDRAPRAAAGTLVRAPADWQNFSFKCSCRRSQVDHSQHLLHSSP